VAEVNATCSTCAEPVLRTPGGLLLEPEPHWSGVRRPDGTRISGSDIVAGRHGHRAHVCAESPAAQQILFDLPSGEAS